MLRNMGDKDANNRDSALPPPSLSLFRIIFRIIFSVSDVLINEMCIQISPRYLKIEEYFALYKSNTILYSMLRKLLNFNMKNCRVILNYI